MSIMLKARYRNAVYTILSRNIYIKYIKKLTSLAMPAQTAVVLQCPSVDWFSILICFWMYHCMKIKIYPAVKWKKLKWPLPLIESNCLICENIAFKITFRTISAGKWLSCVERSVYRELGYNVTIGLTALLAGHSLHNTTLHCCVILYTIAFHNQSATGRRNQFNLFRLWNVREGLIKQIKHFI